MSESYYEIGGSGVIPTGLPGGFLIYEADEDERILFAEANIAQLFGCESFEDFIDYVGGTFRGMVHPEDLEKVEAQIQSQTAFGEFRHDYVRYRIITRQGEVRYVEDFGHLLHRMNGKSFFYVFLVDVDQNEYYNKSHVSLAEGEILSVNRDVDPLTGLLNMAAFFRKVSWLLSSPEARRRDCAIAHFDIPNFKLYNERLGFRMGDQLLKDFGKAIRGVFPDGTVARFSDDHFAAFDFSSRERMIDKAAAVYKRMLLAEDINKKVRIKAGIYCFDSRSTEVGLACDHARLACNSIKHRHDVHYCVYDEMMRERMRRQQYVVDNVERAIEREYIQVFYQPVVRVKTAEICGYEALVRWIDPDVGFLSPADFIDTLEQFHLIHLLDQFVVRRVCEDYRALAGTGEPVVPVSINISRLDFDLCDIFGIIEQTCAEYQVPRAMLDIEITESALNNDPGHIKYECDKMKALGYHIWLDDFGSGYSSLNSIANYSFDVLKLDLVFLRSREHNAKTGTLMNYITDGARELGTEPLCEGVETQEQYEFLKSIGCERAQGYYFGKPMPMRETRSFTAGKGMRWEGPANT